MQRYGCDAVRRQLSNRRRRASDGLRCHLGNRLFLSAICSFQHFGSFLFRRLLRPLQPSSHVTFYSVDIVVAQPYVKRCNAPQINRHEADAEWQPEYAKYDADCFGGGVVTEADSRQGNDRKVACFQECPAFSWPHNQRPQDDKASQGKHDRRAPPEFIIPKKVFASIVLSECEVKTSWKVVAMIVRHNFTVVVADAMRAVSPISTSCWVTV
mmetsp:Transcript_20218/g.57404  ORF Transcript_20218/g.57404 Transcript_20218/m.57404 type:complete len:212 (+) Transcript_20218:837-1472(+)